MPWATRTGARLRRCGYEPIIAPLLSVQTLRATVHLDGVGALAFTSAHGVLAFAQMRAERHLPVFAVGDGTAQVAREVGFRTVYSAGGDLSDLTRLIAGGRASFSGKVLRPGALQPAGNIEAELAALHIEAASVPVYETTATSHHLVCAALADRAATLDAILVHSPRGAVELARIAPQLPGAASVAVCISPAAAAPLAASPFSIRVAQAPTEDAMHSALESELAPR